ncbi:hypothetical protein ACRQ5Q_18575 [Bradyrhizobium sp. PMVTL-01]|uniref:hypothetical protein n=1 Tax=Bradyrhizobium sp. PMVTL-01 TaxID=3434999 RepID=UPI003F725F95
MKYRLDDPKEWRGRPQLQGKPTSEGVSYIGGPRVGKWVWAQNASPVLDTLELSVYNTSLGTFDRIREKRAQLERGGKLTESGIRDEMTKLGATAKQTLARAKNDLADIKREVAERRAKIKPTERSADEDPTRKLQKMEIRIVLRSMSHRELLATLAGPNPNTLFVEALLESDPRMIANVSPSLRKLIESKAVEAKFGPEIEELDEIDHAIATAERALSVAADGVDREINGGAAEPTRAAAPPLVKAV